MKTATLFTVFLVVTASAPLASAHGVTWQSNSAQYDNGSVPSVALTEEGSDSLFQMEVHQGDGADLWDHALGNYAQFGSATRYTGGYYPTVGSDGLFNFVEIHQGSNGSSPELWFSFGTGSAGWTNAAEVGLVGFNPTITASSQLNGASPIAVEVHQAQQGAGSLIFDVGYPTLSGNTWTGISKWEYGSYNSGYAPSVSIYPLDAIHYLVIEVHQAGTGYGALWSDAGLLTLESGGGWIINWSSSSQFTSGQFPSVAICVTPDNDDVTVVEVNQGDNDASLWSHTGVFSFSWNGSTWNNSFSWTSGSDHHYTNGYHPRVDCERYPGAPTVEGLEVHQGGANPGPLWYATFTAN
jgi:hypothetical protein